MPLIDGTTPVGSLFFRFFCLCVTASRFDCALLKFDYLWRNIFLHVVAIYIGHISATMKPYIKSQCYSGIIHLVSLILLFCWPGVQLCRVLIWLSYSAWSSWHFYNDLIISAYSRRDWYRRWIKACWGRRIKFRRRRSWLQAWRWLRRWTKTGWRRLYWNPSINACIKNHIPISTIIVPQLTHINNDHTPINTYQW